MTPIELLKIYLENQHSEQEAGRKILAQLDGRCEHCGLKRVWTPLDKFRLAEKHYVKENFRESDMKHLCPACCQRFMEFIS